MTQFDIKRVIAYSTCSQLGFMFFALGVGAYGAAVFHLFTHAFFKALLFLGAGSVIHAMHHEQDMRAYGGLRKHIPITFLVMMIGTLAITGFPFMAGFYSKDAILESAFMSHTSVGYLAYGLGTFTALMTSFYSWRLMLLTFWGQPRWAQSEHIQHAMHDTHDSHAKDVHVSNPGDTAHHHEQHPADAHATAPTGTAGYHPHESPWVMLIPLLALSLGAVAAGFAFFDSFVGHHRAEFWNGAITVVGKDVLDVIHDIPVFWKWLPTVAMVVGLLLALYAYHWRPGFPKTFTRMFRDLHSFIFHKWYFDELYQVLFVAPARWLGGQFWRLGDGKIIDGLGPDGLSNLVQATARRAKFIQTGYLYHYAFAMLLAVAAALAWILPSVGKAVSKVIGG
jgi:NADH-quinone oxidoreductase subunit L